MALKWLRDQLKYLSWVLWLIVVAFIITLFFGFGTIELGSPRHQVAATVGDENISYAEFRDHYRSTERRYREMFGEQFNSDMARQFNLPKQALDQLIDQRILLMEADRLGLRATDQEVQQTIRQVARDENGKFIGRDELKRRLRASRTSEAQFAEDIRQDVLLNKLRDVLSATSFVSDADLEKIYRDQNETADIRYMKVPATYFQGQVSADEASIDAYFAEHASDYERPEQRVVDYLLVDTVKLRRELEIPDEELQAYYDSHQEDYTRDEQVRARHILLKIGPDRDEAAAKAQIEAAKARAAAGEDFAALARDLSDDEGSAQRGGSLGFFGRGAMVPEFEKAAFESSPGELVVVKSTFGYHLIEVQEKRQAGLQPFDEVRNAVRARLLGERVNEISESKAQDIAQRLKADAEGTVERARLETLGEEEGIEVQTTSPFGEGEPVAGIGRVPEFTEAAFGLAQGTVSDAVKVPRGWVIMRLAEINEPRVPELDEVRNEVQQAVEQELQKAAATERLTAVRSELAAGKSIDDAASEFGVEVTDSLGLSRYGTIAGLTEAPKVIAAALQLESGSVSEPIETADGAVLFEVTERKMFDPEAFEEAKETTRSQEANKRLGNLLQSMVELRRRDLEPQYSRRVIEEWEIQPTAG